MNWFLCNNKFERFTGTTFHLYKDRLSLLSSRCGKDEVISRGWRALSYGYCGKAAVFSLFLPHKRPFSYQIHMTFRMMKYLYSSEAYSYEGLITKKKKNYSQKETGQFIIKMGCHEVKLGNTEGMYFAVWAPGARRVSVVGDFNY